ncbi:MFS myo-inositol transporter [Aspergillus ellipticus CBS 707.79]|uniref:MFS myo-inositol transporter n=1 Tax=Aspergillus ellipticus CBS 707.79 TaxID=1448320 RepID=A0A319DJ20_9EURO|nr:MFS myo-inositol transporter [Aspergillus ellipticus CBS 707.79]
MNHRDENELSDSNAPLLPSTPLGNGDSHYNDDIGLKPTLDTERTGGWFIWALTFSAGISGLLFGYDTGVISSTLVSIGSDLSNRPLTTLDKSLVTSCTSLFALIASPLTGILADKFGRKRIILIADVLFTLGALMQAVTSTVWGMIVGRSIVGLAVGGASLVTPLYISEIAPSHARGRLVTILSLFITGGQVIAYIAGWLSSSFDGGWQTPRWLVQAGFDEKAAYILSKVYRGHPDGDLVARKVMLDIQQEVADEQEDKNIIQRARSLFLVGSNRRALIIAVMLQGVQQLCGFNSVMYFSATIFSLLSFSSPTLTSLSVAITNFIFTLFAFTLIDKIGRRRILLYSIPVMALSLIVCALMFTSVKTSPGSRLRADEVNAIANSSFLPIAILLCLIVYTACYAFGLGNVPWQQSELFPLNVRSLGSALATATNWGSNFIVGLTFLPMMEWLSPGWTFTAYAAVCVSGWFCVWAIYPEMNGLSLEEVKGLLADGWGVQESLIQHIACLLPEDTDVAHFSQCCSTLAAKTLPAQSSIWRGRFRDLYELMQHQEQTLWLMVIRDMLLEYYELFESNDLASKNLQRVRHVLFGSDFLNRPVSGYSQKEADCPSDLFCAVQLCLTELALDPLMSVRCLRKDYDIGVVYSYGADVSNPIGTQESLDLERILHICNFWLRHLLNPDEATFYSSFSNLTLCHRPNLWANNSFMYLAACIHPYPKSLGSLEDRQTCADLDTHWTQSLQLKSDSNPLNWPPVFNTVLPVTGLDSHRSYFHGIQKSRGSPEEAINLVRGFCEPVSIHQGGVPGWRHICFVIYELEREQNTFLSLDDDNAETEGAWLVEEEWPPSDLELDFRWIRGYEGVILPGNRIMMGRWLDMVDTADRGPFLLWKK